MEIFYPSCNYTKASRDNALKVRKYFKEHMKVAVCCLYDKNEVTKDDVGIYLCQACRTQIENKIQTKSIWEYFLEQDISLPDYSGKKMVLVDCFRDREHSEVHEATRKLCQKMNIEIVELKYNRENSRYCGTLHYETDNEELLEELKNYPDMKISALPEDLQVRLMQDYFKDVDEDLMIICDCNRCLKGVQLSGRKGIHLLDLIMNDSL